MTTNNLLTVPSIPKKLAVFKRKLRRARISFWLVAQAAEVTDAYVWMVLNGRRRSPRVLAAVERLLNEAHQKDTSHG